MVAVPGDIPVTAPDAIFTVAIAVFRLLQVPPVTALLNVTKLPWHMDNKPVTGACEFTVTMVVEEQPPGVL